MNMHLGSKMAFVAGAVLGLCLLAGSPRQALASDDGYRDALWGCPWQAASIATLEIGKTPGKAVSYRFRATATDKVTVVALFLKTGFVNGTGGQVRVELQGDDGTPDHCPNGTVLGSATVTDPKTAAYRKITLDAPAALTAGTLYHIVLTNPDADPATNFTSVYALGLPKPVPSPKQPAYDDTDLALLVKKDAKSAWAVQDATPVFSMTYATAGVFQGQSYYDVATAFTQKIQDVTQVREEFKNSTAAPIVVTSVSIYLKKSGAPGDLKIALTQMYGQVMEEGKIPADSVPVSYGWVTYTFAKPQSLAPKSRYYLTLSAPAGDAYEIYPLQDRSADAFFAQHLANPDTWAEYTTDGKKWTIFNGSMHYSYMIYFTRQQ